MFLQNHCIPAHDWLSIDPLLLWTWLLKKIGFDPKKVGVKGSVTPKFQSLNRAMDPVIVTILKLN